MKKQAFTLTEAIIAIAVISLIVGIMIPVLFKITRARNDVMDLSNLRNTKIDFNLYASAHKGRFVNAGTPSEITSPLYYGGDRSFDTVINLYGGQLNSWTTVLFYWSKKGERHWHSSYEEFATITPGMTSAWDNYMGGGWSGLEYTSTSNYLYSNTMITKSTAWTSTGVRGDRRELAPQYFDFVYQSQVAHPSSKATIVQSDRPHSPDSKTYAFADGSASFRNLSDAHPTAIPFESTADIPGSPCLSTLHGFEGKDF